MAETFRHVQQGSIGFIGPAFSSSTIQVSRVLSIPSIDRAVIGYSATSSELSDSAFSNFVRAVPTDDVPTIVVAELMKGRFILCVIQPVLFLRCGSITALMSLSNACRHILSSF